MEVDEILNIYKRPPTPPPATSMPPPKTPPKTSRSSDPLTSPIFGGRRRSNPFRRSSLKLPDRARLYPTVIDDTAIACSKFFAPKNQNNDDAPESMAVNVDEDDYKENMKKIDRVETKKNIIIPETEDVEETINPMERSVLVPDTQEFDDEPMVDAHSEDIKKKAVIIEETQGLDISMTYAAESNKHIIPETEDCDQMVSIIHL